MPTPDRILDAAFGEFSERGFDGTRMEHVARRAGLNKALVYRWFGDKEGLFEATLVREIERRMAFIDALPDDPAATLIAWARRQREDAPFIRLIAREGLRGDSRKPIASEARQAYYRHQIGLLKTWQRDGRLRDDLDPQGLFMALLLLTVGPILLPQLAGLILNDDDAGRDDLPDEATVDARWESFLQELMGALQSGDGS